MFAAASSSKTTSLMPLQTKSEEETNHPKSTNSYCSRGAEMVGPNTQNHCQFGIFQVFWQQ